MTSFRSDDPKAEATPADAPHPIAERRAADIAVPLPRSLAELEALVARDFAILAHPAKEWLKPVTAPDGNTAYDVVVVGGGHSGIAAAIGLLRERITNIVVLDENPPGEEGPWLTYARMPDLRTKKTVTGLEHGFSNLTFRAYYEAREGSAEAYAAMPRITCPDWVAYLHWLRKVLRIPVRNDARVLSIKPELCLFRIGMMSGGRPSTIYARRVVLATGPLSMGGPIIPEPVKSIDKRLWAHAYERFDCRQYAGKRVAVVGGGSTAFDNAAEMLRSGAAEVHLMVRRERIYRISVIRWADWAGFLHSFSELGDRERWNMMRLVRRSAAPPTPRAFARVESHPCFRIHFGAPIVAIRETGEGASITTPGEEINVDFLVLATGFRVDLDGCDFLADMRDSIALWRDRYRPDLGDDAPESYALSPYLGPNFQFVEKTPGQAPWLARLFDFNQTAQLSMGPTGRVSGLKYGVRRLIDGITASFLREDYQRHLGTLVAYNDPALEPHPWVESEEDSARRMRSTL